VLTEEWVLFPQSPSEGRLLSSFGSFEPLFQNFALGHVYGTIAPTSAKVGKDHRAYTGTVRK